MFQSSTNNFIQIYTILSNRNNVMEKKKEKKEREREREKSLIQGNYKRRFYLYHIQMQREGERKRGRERKRFQVFTEHGTKDDWHTNHWSRPWSTDRNCKNNQRVARLLPRR